MTAQRNARRHRVGRSSSYLVDVLALRPATMPDKMPQQASMIVEPQRLRRYLRWRHIKISSSPTAVTPSIRPRSTASRAVGQRFTVLITVCQTRSSSAAISLAVRPRLMRRVA